jgi:hypothetical protein
MGPDHLWSLHPLGKSPGLASDRDWAFPPQWYMTALAFPQHSCSLGPSPLLLLLLGLCPPVYLSMLSPLGQAPSTWFLPSICVFLLHLSAKIMLPSVCLPMDYTFCHIVTREWLIAFSLNLEFMPLEAVTDLFHVIGNSQRDECLVMRWEEDPQPRHYYPWCHLSVIIWIICAAVCQCIGYSA